MYLIVKSFLLYMHEHTFYSPWFTAGTTELAVGKECGVTDVLYMSHVMDIVVGSRRTCERNGKPFQAARLTPSPDKLPVSFCRNVSDVFQMRKVRATKARNGGFNIDFEAFETAWLTPGSTKLIIVDHHVTDVLKMNEQFDCCNLNLLSRSLVFSTLLSFHFFCSLQPFILFSGEIKENSFHRWGFYLFI